MGYVELQCRLDNYVGKDISSVCASSLGRDLNQNQCAHFVSHMLGYDISKAASCKFLTFADSKNDVVSSATIRVDVVFNEVGSKDRQSLSDASCHAPGLVFVTQARNVRSDGNMGNMPAKHIGIIVWPWVYHYSNTRNQVVRENIDIFKRTFTHVYGGENAVVFFRTDFL